MTENDREIIKKISDLSGDYKCYDNRINHEESLVLDRLLTEIQAYRAIGTVEEFKALKEKNAAKKIVVKKNEDITFFLCPQCNKLVGNSIMRVESSHCSRCGQKLDWSE